MTTIDETSAMPSDTPRPATPHDAPYRAPAPGASSPTPTGSGGTRREMARYVVFAGLAFGVAVGVVVGLVTKDWVTGFHTGFFGGFLFGLAIKLFLRGAGVDVATLAPTPRAPTADETGFEPGEMIYVAGPANHFKGIESVGGRLYLTDRRLRFRSHAFNVQAHDESYALADVARAEPARTLGIVPNGLLVHFADGRRERFVVMSRASWVAAIARARSLAG